MDDSLLCPPSTLPYVPEKCEYGQGKVFYILPQNLLPGLSTLSTGGLSITDFLFLLTIAHHVGIRKC